MDQNVGNASHSSSEFDISSDVVCFCGSALSSGSAHRTSSCAAERMRQVGSSLRTSLTSFLLFIFFPRGLPATDFCHVHGWSVCLFSVVFFACP